MLLLQSFPFRIGCAIFIYSSIFISVLIGLKDVAVNVPIAATVGDTVTLQCNYDLENDTLYTVKWHKNGKEFYRYIPKELPHSKVFPVPGINVDIHKSGPNEVVLRDVQKNLTGRFRCEVSADAPSFHTVRVSGLMSVIEQPHGKINVTSEKKRYSIGETLRANCSSPPSSPATNLTWFLNEVQFNSSYLIRFPESNNNQISHSQSLLPTTVIERNPIKAPKFVTIVGIEVELKPSMFQKARLRLKCVSSLFNLFETNSEILIDEERPRLASVLGSKASTFSFSKMPQELIIFLTKVMRKIQNRHFPDDKWEKILVRLLKLMKFDELDLAEIEQKGFRCTDISCRLRVFKTLTDALIDRNQKLRGKIPTMAIEQLKSYPLGVDMNGYVYWKTHDEFGNLRVFCENRLEDSWTVIAKSLEDYKKVIDKLEKETKNRNGLETIKDESGNEIELKNEDADENEKKSPPKVLENSPSTVVNEIESTQNGAINSEKTADDDDGISHHKVNATNGSGKENDVVDTKINCDVEIKSDLSNENDDSKNGVGSEKPECSETIEEAVMIVTGEGSGHECDMGNFAILNRNDDIVIVEDASKNGPVDDINVDSEQEEIEAIQSSNASENVDSDTNRNDDKIIEKQGESEQVDSTVRGLKKRKKRIRKFTPIKKRTQKAKEASKMNSVTEQSNKSPIKRKGRPHKKAKQEEQKLSESDEPDNTEKQQLLQKLESNPLLRKIKLMGANLDDVETLKNISSVLDDSEVMVIKPVRLSSRLAKIKIKQAVTPKKLLVSSGDGRLKDHGVINLDSDGLQNNGEDDDVMYSSSDDKSHDSKKKQTKARQNQKNSDKKAMWKMGTPSTSSLSAKRKRLKNQKRSSSESLMSSVEEEDSFRFVVQSDHEFSPESNLSVASDAQPRRHARTAVLRKTKAVASRDYEQTVCEKCSTSCKSDTILLCDSCDNGWHLACLTPVLYLVPEGDWFCPKCQHVKLIATMKEDLAMQTKIVRTLKNKEQRKKRLDYVGISLSNVLPIRKQPKHDTQSRSGSGSSSTTQSRSDSCASNSSEDSDRRHRRRNLLRKRRFQNSSSEHSSSDYSSGNNSSNNSSLDDRKSKSSIAKRKDGNDSGSGSGRSKEKTHYYNNRPLYQIRETRRRNKANYLFSEYDDMIKKAIGDEMRLSAKDWPKTDENVDVGATADTPSTSNPADAKDENNENSEFVNPVAQKLLKAKKKRRKFNDLDSDGEFDDDNVETDQEFKIESGSNSNVTEEEDNSFSGAGSNSSNSSEFQFTKRTGRTYAHYRSNRHDNDFVVSDEDEGEDGSLRRSRRVRKAPTKYLYDQESDGSGSSSKHRKKKRRVKRDSSFEEKSLTSSNESETKMDCDSKNEDVDDGNDDNDSIDENPTMSNANQQSPLKSCETE